MSICPSCSYLGRFAPSPTGPLHFGSLVAAAGSYFDARAHGGHWLLRMEDLDTPRCIPGAADSILRTLEQFGFEWDAKPVWQSQRSDAYQTALDQLIDIGQAFPCACTRRELADAPRAADGSRIYPGTCRHGLPPGRQARAWRVRAHEGCVTFRDLIQGNQREELAREVGDFIVRRADGLFAYQLAVVIDDADAGITHVVRGADLLSSTCRQIHLQKILGYQTPQYAHLPVATNEAGEKLSKQTLADAVDDYPAPQALVLALQFLNQSPPPELARASIAEIHAWACHNWHRESVAAQLSQPAPTLPTSP